MNEQKEWIVDGFAFYDHQTAQLAWQERRKIEYLEKHMDMEDSLPEDILTVYEKILHDRMFQTPVGIRYLDHMQALLRMSEEIANDEIEPIPLHVYYETVQKNSEGGEESNPDTTDQSTQDPTTQDQTIHDEAVEDEAVLSRTRQERMRRADRQADKTPLIRNLIFVNIALIITVIAMFFIALTGKQPNILNYERVLQNRYAAWEQELTQLETQLRQKELELSQTK